MKSIYKTHLFLFFAILLVAIFLRFHKLGQIPVVLNRDEASLGYTAYSILKTGKDEHGVTIPINIESFGDWKLPGYVYTLIPFIAVFGLNDWTVRLPSAIAGLLIVLLGYFISKEILIKEKYRDTTSLILMAFLAISPWAVHLSRIAYEANLAMALFLLGFLLFLKSLTSKNVKIVPFLFFGSAVFWALTLYTYHAYQVFTPLFAVVAVVFYRKRILFLLKKNKHILTPAILVGLVMLGFLLFGGTSSANNTKFSGLSIFNLDSYLPKVAEKRMLLSSSQGLFSKLYSNKFLMFSNQVTNNFFNLFSTEFLFISGGTNGAHNISGFGNFYKYTVVLIVISIFSFLKKKKNWQKLISLWIAIAAIAPMITFESNHTIRFSPAFFAFELMAAYGLWVLFNWVSKLSIHRLLKISFKALIIFIIFSSAFNYAATYFYSFPKQDLDRWPWHMKKLSFILNENFSNYDSVIMQGESSSPYIYLLNYLKIDPTTAQNNLEYYPPTNEGFKHVKKLGRYEFQSIKWNDPEILSKKTLFIVQPEEIPTDKREGKSYSLEYTLTDPNSKYVYELWSYKP